MTKTKRWEDFRAGWAAIEPAADHAALLGITSATTDDELRALVAREVADAGDAYAVDAAALLAYLKQLRAEVSLRRGG